FGYCNQFFGFEDEVGLLWIASLGGCLVGGLGFRGEFGQLACPEFFSNGRFEFRQLANFRLFVELLERRCVSGALRPRADGLIAAKCSRGKKRLQAVIIPLGKRLKFVIVAPGTAER